MDLGDASRLPGRALTIWAASDGRVGIENQVLGLAQAVAELAPSSIVIKRLRWRPWLRRLPTRLAPSARLVLDPGADALAPPWPDVFIGAGRAVVPTAIALRRWSKGRSFVVQLQDPLRNPRLFDLVIPPAHDRLQGDNVFPILGAPHRVTPTRLAAERAPFTRLDALPHPRVAVLIGGRSKAFDISPARATALAQEIATAVRRRGGAVMVTFSRRTPAEAQAIFREHLAPLAGWIWDGVGENPYFAFLEAADHIIVTADSINMAVEAASTGKPMLIAAVDGRQARKDRFHADMRAHGATRPWRGELQTWTYAPLRETQRAAAEILRRLAERGSP